MKKSNYINGNIITDENGNEWIANKNNENLLFLGTNQEPFDSLEGDMVELWVPDSVGGKTLLKCMVIKNQDCAAPVLASDLEEYEPGKFKAIQTY